MITQRPVGRIFLIAAGIAYPRTNHSVDAPEPGIRTPKSAKSKRGGFDLSRRRSWAIEVFILHVCPDL
jgi:hypothetical protein